ncbi:glycoside hydrolase family 28 protein [Melioribacter sp. OK-6-Me]|uniref:glycoside hydrolase family 28 protein n=1 Tax=unclassified Melioribacter TaxID=2627329 RepID=UPI003ED8405D
MTTIKFYVGIIVFFLPLFIHPQTLNDPWKKADEILQNIHEPLIPPKVFNITDFADSTSLHENIKPALDRAINECSLSGGGKIFIPAGVYKCKGPIHFKSNVNLHLDKNSVILFSTNPKDYLPVVFTRWEGVECYNYSPLIYGYEVENVAITGEGIFDGMASEENWWQWKLGKNPKDEQKQNNSRLQLLEMNNNNVPVEKRIFGEGHYLRPNFVQFYKSKNILIEEVTFKDSPMWFLHPVLSENIIIRNVKTIGHGPNNDGCDPESCKNVLIEGCYFDNGDDCIAIKSGRNNDGRRINAPSENLIIRNCVMKDGHGGVVIGSEISGGCRYVFAEDCKMDSPNLDRMLRIKSNTIRGGVVEHIYVRNIEVGEVSNAIVRLNMFYDPKEIGPRNFPPKFRNIRVEKVTSQKSEFALEFLGLEESPIENVEIIDCDFNGVRKGNSISFTRNLILKNVKINGKEIN